MFCITDTSGAGVFGCSFGILLFTFFPFKNTILVHVLLFLSSLFSFCSKCSPDINVLVNWA